MEAAAPIPPRPFKVMVDDNYHYMDQSERYALGEYATLEEATMAARQVVDEFLQSAHQPGMDAGELMTQYVMFGEDPFIICSDPAFGGVLFSAREYARWRCDMLCPAA